MKTQKLYETDAYICRFEAEILSCNKDVRGYKLILDKTAFFPNGGGQPSDIGNISGARISDVQIEADEIVHYSDKPFAEGEKVTCEIDFERRHGFMQNHTAEHIVSGLVFKEFGFDNIGFHLNESEVTFDFNGFFKPGQLNLLELEANRVVWCNLSVETFYPSPEELVNIPYRSKDGIDGKIRLVKIGNADICACCAPHVRSTGEIGLIKFLGTEKQHGGTRIFMKCGRYALEDYRKKESDIKLISESLSVRPEDVRSAFLSQLDRLESIRQETRQLKSMIIDCKIKEFDTSKTAVVMEDADIRDLQVLADGLHKTYGGVRIALSENRSGAAFVMCGEEPEIAVEFEELKAVFNIRGGGRDTIRQGSILAPFNEIKEYFNILESL